MPECITESGDKEKPCQPRARIYMGLCGQSSCENVLVQSTVRVDWGVGGRQNHCPGRTLWEGTRQTLGVTTTTLESKSGF